MLDHAMDNPLEIEEHAAAPLAGGIANHGYQCGMLWGAALAAGAQAYRLFGPGLKTEITAIVAAQRLVESFGACNKHRQINCLEITDLNLQENITVRSILKFFVKGQAVHCFRMSAKYAHAAFSDINTALAERHIESPSPPVSCTAMLAQKMGASDMHKVMAAGLAGGIGLSGGGCGALGASIWLNEMNFCKKRTSEKDSYKVYNARAGDIINKFLKGSDYKFECSEIVGRRFENTSDHAAFLRNGGCAEIIGLLAASGT